MSFSQTKFLLRPHSAGQLGAENTKMQQTGRSLQGSILYSMERVKWLLHFSSIASHSNAYTQTSPTVNKYGWGRWCMSKSLALRS